MKFNTDGVACYGYSVVNVDGAVPAPLVGRTVGQPSWQSTTQLVYQDGDAGDGPWQLDQLTYPGLTTANLTASGANITGGGGGVWAKWLGGEGVTTSWGGPFADAFLAWVSSSGQVVVVDNYQAGTGLTVYDDVGATLFELPTVVLLNLGTVRLQDNILAYLDSAGWHLVDITTGETPSWYPRLDGVNYVVPVTFDGTLYLLERTEELTLRAADRAVGWILRAFPDTFTPDAVALASVVRCGSCLNIGELVDSLMVFDVTVSASSQIEVSIGTVSGGGIVYAADVPVDPTVFLVGPLEGHSLTSKPQSPTRHPVVDRKIGDLITRPWMQWAQAVDQAVATISGVVQNTPMPAPGGSAFTQVIVTGEPPLQANLASQTITLTSVDDSVTMTTNPATNTLDVSVAVGGYGPVTTGAEPLVFVSDGAGHVLMTPYTP